MKCEKPVNTEYQIHLYQHHIQKVSPEMKILELEKCIGVDLYASYNTLSQNDRVRF